MTDSSLFLDQLQHFKSRLDERADVFFRSLTIDPDFSESEKQIELLHEYFMRGGKRIRGYLLRLGFLSFKKPAGFSDALFDFALGIELAHAGLLIQDDIFDKDSVRRGGASFHLLMNESSLDFQEGSGPYGSIVFSDILVQLGYSLMIRSSFDNVHKVRALSYIQDQAFYTAVGEFSDLYFASSDRYDEAVVSFIARLKTSYYTFLSTFVVGALLSGEKIKDLKGLEQALIYLGLLFQIRDDFMVLSSGDVSLKNPLSDIGEEKVTFLTAFLRSRGLEYVKVDSVDELFSIASKDVLMKELERLLLYYGDSYKEYSEKLSDSLRNQLQPLFDYLMEY